MPTKANKVNIRFGPYLIYLPYSLIINQNVSVVCDMNTNYFGGTWLIQILKSRKYILWKSRSGDATSADI